MIPRLILYSIFVIFLLSVPVTATSVRPGPNDQESIVLQLYRDFAWEAVMNQPTWKGLIDQPREILERYFDEKLTSLILQDRACAKKQGLCKLDFLPIWGSQDPMASDLEVHQSAKPSIVSVKFRIPSNNETVILFFQMSKTKKGWRISNISSSNWSLLSILSN